MREKTSKRQFFFNLRKNWIEISLSDEYFLTFHFTFPEEAFDCFKKNVDLSIISVWEKNENF